jgi:hypothetical protein
MLEDPNAPQEQEPEPPPPPQPEPEPPQIDIESAYQAIAQHQGWDPRLTQYELQEIKRRREELDRERRELEAERSRRYEPPEDNNTDPYMRRMDRLERILVEREERERKERDERELTTRVANDLHASYTSMARQAGMTRQQMEEKAEEIYEVLADMYPVPGMVQSIGADRAVRNAFRVIGASRQTAQRPNINGRGPTAVRTIPGSPQAYIPGGGVLPPEENLSAEQMEGETDDQYRARLERIINGANVKRLPDGYKVSSR